MRVCLMIEGQEGVSWEEWVVGTVDEVAARLQKLETAGVERIFLQHLAHDDVEMVRLLGAEVAPAVANR